MVRCSQEILIVNKLWKKYFNVFVHMFVGKTRHKNHVNFQNYFLQVVKLCDICHKMQIQTNGKFCHSKTIQHVNSLKYCRVHELRAGHPGCLPGGGPEIQPP